MTNDDANFERALAGALPGDRPADDGEGHPSADALAGLAEGRLPEEGRAALERHLAACFMCRAIAAGLGGRETVEAGAASAPSAVTAPRRRWIPWAAAAMVLVGVGAFLLLRSGAGSGSSPAAEDPDAALLASAKVLAQARPDLFADFVPLDHATRIGAKPDALRGGVALRGPREIVLTGKPTFRWAAVGRVKNYLLTLRGADGVVVWTRKIEGTEAPFPADAAELPPGSTWQWGISGKRAAGPFDGSLGFHVASEAEATRFAEAERELRARVAAGQADLLWAHWAAKAGLLEEAERAVGTYLAKRSGDAVAGETLDYVRARLGFGVEVK